MGSTVPTGTDTLSFISPGQISDGRKATYLRVVVADRPEKPQPRRVRWTVGGNRVQYPGDVTTKTADLVTAKTLFNSVISTTGARYMTIDLKDFYLGTPLDRYECLRVPVKMLTPKIIELYKLQPLIVNGHVYAEIRKGMCGPPQAGILANKHNNS